MTVRQLLNRLFIEFEGMDDILAGYGQPVDEIDSACKRYKQCVKCALTDFGTEVCPWYKPYKMTAMVDTETGEKHLVCKDKGRVSKIFFKKKIEKFQKNF